MFPSEFALQGFTGVKDGRISPLRQGKDMEFGGVFLCVHGGDRNYLKDGVCRADPNIGIPMRTEPAKPAAEQG